MGCNSYVRKRFLFLREKEVVFYLRKKLLFLREDGGYCSHVRKGCCSHVRKGLLLLSQEDVFVPT
jgi:hypothetical protein